MVRRIVRNDDAKAAKLVALYRKPTRASRIPTCG